MFSDGIYNPPASPKSDATPDALAQMQREFPGTNFKGIKFAYPLKNIPHHVSEFSYRVVYDLAEQNSMLVKTMHNIGEAHKVTQTHLDNAEREVEEGKQLIATYKRDTEKLEEKIAAEREALALKKETLGANNKFMTTQVRDLSENAAKLSADNAALAKGKADLLGKIIDQDAEILKIKGEAEVVQIDAIAAQTMRDAALAKIKELESALLAANNANAAHELDASASKKHIELLEDKVDAASNILATFCAGVIRSKGLSFLEELYPQALCTAWEKIKEQETSKCHAIDEEKLMSELFSPEEVNMLKAYMASTDPEVVEAEAQGKTSTQGASTHIPSSGDLYQKPAEAPVILSELVLPHISEGEEHLDSPQSAITPASEGQGSGPQPLVTILDDTSSTPSAQTLLSGTADAPLTIQDTTTAGSEPGEGDQIIEALISDDTDPSTQPDDQTLLSDRRARKKRKKHAIEGEGAGAAGEGSGKKSGKSTKE